MQSRSDLNDLFLEMIDNVYFQPPATVQMEYPCIVYKRDDIDAKFADNISYSRTQRYLVTHISKAPDSDALEQIGSLPLCRFRRYFVANNLNHDVFELYF